MIITISLVGNCQWHLPHFLQQNTTSTRFCRVQEVVEPAQWTYWSRMSCPEPAVISGWVWQQDGTIDGTIPMPGIGHLLSSITHDRHRITARKKWIVRHDALIGSTFTDWMSLSRCRSRWPSHFTYIITSKTGSRRITSPFLCFYSHNRATTFSNAYMTPSTSADATSVAFVLAKIRVPSRTNFTRKQRNIFLDIPNIVLIQ